MTTTWTLFNSAGPLTISVPSGPLLALSYGRDGTVGLSTGQSVTICEYTGEDDPVSVVLTTSSDNSLDQSETSVTITPAGAPDATWAGSNTGTVTLTFPNPTTNAGTTWVYEMIPTDRVPEQEPIALKVKIVVKRPPTEDRRS